MQNIVIKLYTKKRKVFGEFKYNKENFQNFAKHFHTTLNIVAIGSKSIDINYHLKPKVTLYPDEIAIFNPQ